MIMGGRVSVISNISEFCWRTFPTSTLQLLEKWLLPGSHVAPFPVRGYGWSFNVDRSTAVKMSNFVSPLAKNYRFLKGLNLESWSLTTVLIGWYGKCWVLLQPKWSKYLGRFHPQLGSSYIYIYIHDSKWSYMSPVSYELWIIHESQRTAKKQFNQNFIRRGETTRDGRRDDISDFGKLP